MSVNIETENSVERKKFIRKHWNIIAIFVIVGISLIVGAIYVFLWFVGDAQSTNLVPSTLGLWTLGHTVSFILHLIFWELILIGIPLIIAGALGWQWWRRLPVEEKVSNFFGRRSRTRDSGGAVSPLLFIAFAIKVYIDGNWNIAISTWKLDYVVGSMITILIWIAAIFGIPLAIGVIWWLSHEKTKS